MRAAAGEAALIAARERTKAEAVSPLEGEVVELFDQLRARLLRYTLNFGLPVEDGEEVVQEVFMSLFQHLQEGKPRENLRGWIFRVAHNLALKRRTALSSAGAAGAQEMNSRLADPEPNPEDQLASQQAQQKLLAVFRVLPEADQRCLMLRAEGLRYREISQVLGMSLGAVSISLSRSLARLTRASER